MRERTTVRIEKVDMAELLRMNSEPGLILAFFPCTGKPSCGREQHMIGLDTSDRF
jgi:hypothetical protein